MDGEGYMLVQVTSAHVKGRLRAVGAHLGTDLRVQIDEKRHCSGLISLRS